MAIDPNDFEFIRRLVHERSAVAIGPGKVYLVEAHLAPLVEAEGVAGIAELIGRIHENPSGALTEQLVEAMISRGTQFFRDRPSFDSLRESVLPELIERRDAEKQLNVWCAGCSSGQEPYSVCMVLREHFPELIPWDIEVLATDLSRSMIERARSGVYSQLEVNRGLPAELLPRYFVREGKAWRVSAELRAMVTFEEQNLAGPWGMMPEFDLVLVRNVLCDFDAATRKDVIGRLRRQLRPGGVMLLGGSETLVHTADEFERVRRGRSWIYRSAG